MARKGFQLPPEEGEGETEAWLVTYGDMVTLLLCFFIMLMGFSTIDPAKLEEVLEGFEGSVVGKIKQRVDIEEIRQKVNEIIREEGLVEQVDITLDPDGMAINLKGGYMFPSAAAELQEAAKPLLLKIVSEIKETPFRIAVEGHSDDAPIHTEFYPSNWELATARACNVINFFIAEGIEPILTDTTAFGVQKLNRFEARGFADTRPRVPNRDSLGVVIPENRAINRRVVVKFLTK